MAMLPPVAVELIGRIGGFQAEFGKARAEFQKLRDSGGSAMSQLSAISTGAYAAIGTVLAGVGAAIMHNADEFENARAQLEVAVKNVGGSFEELSKHFKATDDAMTKLGYSNAQTESAMASLTAATKSPAKAMQDMALAADIARGRGIDLASATAILIKVETNHVGLLGKMGINIKDATGHIISQEEAVKRLSDMYGGQAEAHAKTFGGQMEVLRARLANVAAHIGQYVMPALMLLLRGIDDVVTGVEKAVSWFGRLIGRHEAHASAALKAAEAEKANNVAMQEAADEAEKGAESYDKLQTAVMAAINAQRGMDQANRAEAQSEQTLANDRRALSDLLRKGAVDTKAVQSAQDQLHTSTEHLTKAQKDLAAAQLNVLQVQNGLNPLDLQQANLSAEDATNSLAHAQANLDTLQKAAGTSALDLSDAQHQVEQAQIDSLRAQYNLTKMNDEGRAGSDTLKAAQNQLEQAQQTVTDATHRQAEAQAALRTAQAGDPDFAAKVSAAQEKLSLDTQSVTDAKLAQVTASQSLIGALKKEQTALGDESGAVWTLTDNLSKLETQFGLTRGTLSAGLPTAINPDIAGQIMGGAAAGVAGAVSVQITVQGNVVGQNGITQLADQIQAALNQKGRNNVTLGLH